MIMGSMPCIPFRSKRSHMFMSHALFSCCSHHRSPAAEGSDGASHTAGPNSLCTHLLLRRGFPHCKLTAHAHMGLQHTHMARRLVVSEVVPRLRMQEYNARAQSRAYSASLAQQNATRPRQHALHHVQQSRSTACETRGPYMAC